MRSCAKEKKQILRFIDWFFLSNAFLFWILGSPFLKNIFSSATLFKNAISDFSGPLGKVFIVFFWLVSYLSFMTLLAFIPALLLRLVAWFIPARRSLWFLSVLLATLSLAFLSLDSRIYMMFKFHVNWIIVKLIFQAEFVDFFDFSKYELVLFSSLLGLLCLLEGCLAYLLWKKIILKERLAFEKTMIACWLGGCVSTYFFLLISMALDCNLLTQQTINLPFFNQLIAYLMPHKDAKDILRRFSEISYSQQIFSNDKMNYPLHPMRCTKPERPLNLIFIMVDSLRFDSLSYMPNVAQFAEKSWTFKNHLSGGNATQPGLFSIFYSLPGNYWTAALKQKVPAVLTALLIRYDYSIRIFWASVISPYNRTIYLGLSKIALKRSSAEGIGSRDRDITNRAIKFLVNKNHKRPFFLHLFYNAAHGFCRQQDYPAPYQPVIECSPILLGRNFNPQFFYNRYLNAIHFLDGEVARVLSTIEQQGYLENTVVVFTSDHGQEFDDNKQNYWGHTGNFTRAQTQVPLVIHWPGESPRTIDYLTSSYDLAPTLLKRLYGCQNPSRDYSIGQDLLEKTRHYHFILAGSYANMGIIEPDRITTFRTSGGIDVTSINAEPRPLEKPRIDVARQALSLMRRYYASGHSTGH